MTERRYPLLPLIDASHLSSDEARLRAKASGGSWTRAGRDGLSEATADRWAVRLGIDPYNVWPDMLEHVITTVERRCAAPDCPVRFVPPTLRWGQKQRRYCCRTCQQRTNARMRYQTNEATRQRRLEACRQYKAEIAELRARRKQVA